MHGVPHPTCSLELQILSDLIRLHLNASAIPDSAWQCARVSGTGVKIEFGTRIFELGEQAVPLTIARTTDDATHTYGLASLNTNLEASLIAVYLVGADPLTPQFSPLIYQDLVWRHRAIIRSAFAPLTPRT